MTRTRGWYWPWLVAAALFFTVGANVVMLFAANADRNGVVVEPDYYRKAVDWDRTMERQAASDRLGWRTDVALTGAGRVDAEVELRAIGADGRPVTGARFTATLIHNLDAARPVRVQLQEVGDGRYAATAALVHRGLWEVRLEGRRDADRYVGTLRAEAR